ncbi:MAG: hypothetical protein JW999_08225 [Methanotrichaceae archaeon]|nr:hypothetical protein [Methanotrichaceae archaeon]
MDEETKDYETNLDRRLLVSLKPGKAEQKSVSDWDFRMDELAQKVSLAWKREKGAVEVLSEMRR